MHCVRWEPDHQPLVRQMVSLLADTNRLLTCMIHRALGTQTTRHTGFKSMKHLGVEHGFASAVGSFQTGGAYSGPKHSMRWQDDHPIWKDDEFTNKPVACSGGNSSYDALDGLFFALVKSKCRPALEIVGCCNNDC